MINFIIIIGSVTTPVIITTSHGISHVPTSIISTSTTTGSTSMTTHSTGMMTTGSTSMATHSTSMRTTTIMTGSPSISTTLHPTCT